ncbi:hypothetical protein [Streptomyces sp. NPDC050528]|uniref:hypothetical protein n=1 Tax=unclassified Streptomyces TaxID=2593676 RepID=UPI00379754B0
MGAGPVGLALATAFGWRGIPVTVIDQGDGQAPFPAGEAIPPRPRGASSPTSVSGSATGLRACTAR